MILKCKTSKILEQCMMEGPEYSSRHIALMRIFYQDKWAV